MPAGGKTLAPTGAHGGAVRALGEGRCQSGRVLVERVTAGPSDARLDALLEVRRAWLEVSNVGIFSRWLEAAIARARRGVAA